MSSGKALGAHRGDGRLGGGNRRLAPALITGLARALLLAVVLALVVLAMARPGAAGVGPGGAGTGGAAAPKVLVLGFDGMDPQLLARWRAEGLLPNFDRFVAAGGLRDLGTSIPPQSPVAWSNFITGQDAGGHGIFDFIHRDPATLVPYLSTSEAQPPTKFWKLGPWKLPRDGGSVRLLRKGEAFWKLLAEAGVDVTVFKIPSNFPPVECEARSLSGMGTPDILGTYGIFTYVTDRPPDDTDLGGGRVVPVEIVDGGFEFSLPGPNNSYREGDPESAVQVAVTVDPQSEAAVLETGDSRLLLQEGEWSEWVRVEYPLIPMLRKVSGICRFYLMEVQPTFRLYVTPVQIDPEHPAMTISTPHGYAGELADAVGLFYTQGLPEDTKALDEGIFSDAEYVSQSEVVFKEQQKQYRHELARFGDAAGPAFLFFYFNVPDQSCHMFWRNMDGQSPSHAESDPLFASRVRDLYVRLDWILGLALEAVGDEATILVMSDHGFAPYHRSFNVNRWLLDNGYLHLLPGVGPTDVHFLSGVDWTRTRAYAIGINGLYLNLAGRERTGIVGPEERPALLRELRARLEAVVDSSGGQTAIKYAYLADEVYHGPEAATGPDIVLGYRRGFRGSNESALGEIAAATFEDNRLKWSGDHCMAADEVPGILAANRPLPLEDPELTDLAPTLLKLFGVAPLPQMRGRDVLAPGPRRAGAGGTAGVGAAGDTKGES